MNRKLILLGLITFVPFELSGAACQKTSIHHCQFRGSLAFEANSKTKVR